MYLNIFNANNKFYRNKNYNYNKIIMYYLKVGITTRNIN